MGTESNENQAKAVCSDSYHMGSLPISYDVLKQSNIGLWAIEQDEGLEPRMYGDEDMMKILNVDKDATPEQVYQAWFNNIDKDHYDEILKSVEQMAAGIHSEVQYPWHCKDGRTIIIRCGGVRNPKYTKGLRIEGVHHNVTEFSHYEKEKELLAQVKESEKVSESFIKAYSVVYKVNINNDTFTILRMDKNMIGYGMNFETFSQAVDFFINDVVFEPDKEKMRYELDYTTLRQRIASRASYSTEYRILKNGSSVWHEMVVKVVDENQVAIGFVPRNNEIILDHLQSKMNEAYYALFSIDLDTQLFTVFKNAPWYKVTQAGQSVQFQEVLKVFLKDVKDEAYDFFAQFMDADKVKEIFTKEDKRIFTYLSIILKKWITVSLYVVFRHKDGTPATITMGFSFVDSFESEKQKLQEMLKVNMGIIGGFTSDYLAVYHINLVDKSFKVYSIDENQLADTKQLLENNSDPIELIHIFGTSKAVHPNDRALFADLSPETAKKLLAHKKKISIRFRRDYGHGYKWSVMDVVKNEQIDEEPKAITIGFAECDDTVRSELIQTQSLAYLGKGISPDISINEQLSLIGEFYGAERAYIFEFSKDRAFFSNTYEWCAKGVPAMMSELQDLPVKFIDVWVQEFKKKGAFYMDSLEGDTQTTEEGHKILEMHGISSLIAAPIMKGDIIEGFIGVDNPTQAKKNIDVLKTVSAVTYSEILRRKEDDEEHVTLSKLTDAFLSVYYADLSTDYMRTLKITREYEDTYGFATSYNASMGDYVRNHIIEEERERCILQTSKDYILEQFKTKDRFSVEMTDTMTGCERNIVFDFIKVNNESNKLVICCRDLTESLAKQKEQENQLKDALSMAQSANRAKTAFLNNMSHDIRTPMNAIIGYTGLATSHIDSKEQVKNYLGKISKSSNHLLALINDVLDMSRIESGKVNLEESEENLTEITRSLRDLVQAEIKSKQIEFLVDTVDVNDDNFICDRLRLNQVLLNVLSNAVKYTTEGGTVTMQVKELAVTESGYATYEFRIKDNGIGMTQEFLDTIYEPFTRANTSTISGIQGTGLGMSITKNIVDMMGGEIHIQSEIGKGTEVIITFDFKLLNAPKKVWAKKSSVDFAGKKILLVEDNNFNREIATEILQEFGLTLYSAEDGDIAVEKMKAAKKGDYDLILMDIQMPKMNGYEATRQIRALNTEISRIPIIAMTANAFEEDRKTALDAGMDEHVAKPIDFEKLKSTLARFLNQKEA